MANDRIGTSDSVSVELLRDTPKEAPRSLCPVCLKPLPREVAPPMKCQACLNTFDVGDSTVPR